MFALVEKIVYYTKLELVVVGFENLVGFQEKFFYTEGVVVFVYDIFVDMVQKCLVNDHHRMIHNSYGEVFVVDFYSVEKIGNFHYNPV